MNFETGYAEAWAARRNPHIEQAAGNVKPAEQQAGDEDFSFWDFLDVINPLQHIPVVNTLYRELTGDTIKPATQMAGGVIFGGPFGLVTGAFNAMFEQTNGTDMMGTVVATLSGDGSIETGAEPAIAIAEAGEGGLGGVMLASSVGVTDEIQTEQLAALVEGNTSGHHQISGTLTNPDPLASNVLVAAADSYASQRSMDKFLTLASGGTIAGSNPATTQIASARTAPTTVKAPSGGLQLADLPQTAPPVSTTPVSTTPAAANAAEANPQAVSEARPQLASLNRLPAEEASPIPLNDVRRYNRALPLRSGTSAGLLQRNGIKDADVAAAARQIAAQQAAQQALQEAQAAANQVTRVSATTPATAPSAAPVSQPAVQPAVQPGALPPMAPAQPRAIQDPFGRAISGDNFGSKMLDGLEKYRATGRLGQTGI